MGADRSGSVQDVATGNAVGGLPLTVETPFEFVCWGAGLSLRLSKDLLRAFQWRPLCHTPGKAGLSSLLVESPCSSADMGHSVSIEGVIQDGTPVNSRRNHG